MVHSETKNFQFPKSSGEMFLLLKESFISVTFFFETEREHRQQGSGTVKLNLHVLQPGKLGTCRFLSQNLVWDRALQFPTMSRRF